MSRSALLLQDSCLLQPAGHERVKIEQECPFPSELLSTTGQQDTKGLKMSSSALFLQNFCLLQPTGHESVETEQKCPFPSELLSTTGQQDTKGLKMSSSALFLQNSCLLQPTGHEKGAVLALELRGRLTPGCLSLSRS